MWNPRTCGEKSLTCERIDFRLGSPPRRRGKVQLVECILARAGITPAWAGKSKEPLKICEKQEDHPRVGGEKLDLLAVVFSALGSPPRGRGKAGHGVEGGQHLGITPAWAGKRSSLDGKMFKIWDHPRVGGEKSISCWKRSMPVGSPPRGRGKVAYIGNKNGLDGITPAWAGKSQNCKAVYRHRQDHPRVGGEKGNSHGQPRPPQGSPPRGRGKVVGDDPADGVLGITPAWAGKRFHFLFSEPFLWDHPRVGGEKKMDVSYDVVGTGSPPRGRGKDAVWLYAKVGDGITPAWAGKRLKRSHRSGIFISGPIPFHSVLHRPAGSGGSRAGRDGSPAGQPQNTGPA